MLVTGAGGFVGGHIARQLAASGHFVRGTDAPAPAGRGGRSAHRVARRRPARSPAVRRRALSGVRGVIHTASWVSLGPDRLGISHATNVDATSQLLAEAARVGCRTLCLYFDALLARRRHTRAARGRIHGMESPALRLRLHAHQEASRAVGAGGESAAILDDRALPGNGPGTARHQTDVDQDRQSLCARTRGHRPAGRHPDYRRRVPGAGPSPGLGLRRWRRALCGRRALPELWRTLQTSWLH